jgi:putative sigma-54 modulation protein
MKTNIKATGIDLTPSLRSYVEEKLGYVERLLGQVEDNLLANIEIGKTTNHHHSGEVFRAEINLHLAGHDYRAARTDVDLYAAIDQVKDDIVEEIKSYRNKRSTLLRRGSRKLKGMLRGLTPWRK